VIKEKLNMTVTTLPFEEIPQFSGRDKAYTLQDPKLRPFYKYPARLDTIARVIEDKSRENSPRELLVSVLRQQYSELERTPAIDQHIESLLKPSTFTVVTAHQPALFTGPLYFIYKIISTIHLAKAISVANPSVKVVPVMISGGEDHDFEEINHAHLFGKKLVWENQEGGSVGRMSTASLQPLLDELVQLLGESDTAQTLREKLEGAFRRHEIYGRAMQAFVNSLFKDHGLLVINMDHPELKRHFIPHMRRELLEQASQALVGQTQAELESLGFSAQAFARPVNLFYLSEGMRERIELENGVYSVVNTDLTFTESALLEELEAHPERFSPNVVMRPLYQESILPNLAYIGGGGELAYWLERKRQFEHFGINFPMLVRRNSVVWIDGNSAKRMEKLGLDLNALLGDTEDLVKTWVHEKSEQELSLSAEKQALSKLFESIVQKAEATDPTLAGAVKAEEARQIKSLEQLEVRLVRAQKQRFETEINQLRGLKEKLFPGNGLQERYDNFIPHYLRNGETFFDVLLENLDPLRTDLIVIQE
jgi:bacillithiol biosynthesis cysteine-adding enzyme BshC